MATYRICLINDHLTELDLYHLESEGVGRTSLQGLIAQHPELILSIPELEIETQSTVFAIREFSTNRGLIDIVLITESADIVIIETKLLRNPESHRTVVAQAIDYIKSFTVISVEAIKLRLLQSKYSNKEMVERSFAQDFFCATLEKNIKSGNYKVLIVGDRIHPNILGMVESVQSAPHLSFALFLVELKPQRLDDYNILLTPTVVANTIEVERSVIRLEIDYKSERYTIESSIPQEENKGNRPIITDDQYIDNLLQPEFVAVITSFWKNWINQGGDIKFGTVGFTSGIAIGDKRIPIQYVYANSLALISQKYRISIGVPDEIYNQYLAKLKTDVPKAFDLLIGNKVKVRFEDISGKELESILQAAVFLAYEYKGE